MTNPPDAHRATVPGVSVHEWRAAEIEKELRDTAREAEGRDVNMLHTILALVGFAQSSPEHIEQHTTNCVCERVEDWVREQLKREGR